MIVKTLSPESIDHLKMDGCCISDLRPRVLTVALADVGRLVEEVRVALQRDKVVRQARWDPDQQAVRQQLYPKALSRSTRIKYWP
jgi:hypothetical protein